MENQIDKKMEAEMETRIVKVMQWSRRSMLGVMQAKCAENLCG